MQRACKYCGRVHPVGAACPLKPRRKTKEQTDVVRFRSSWAWTQKARQIRERDHHLCRLCLDEGRLCRDNLEVHHIAPLAEAWEERLDDDNLITLCDKCHEQAEQGDIARERLTQLAAREAAYPPDGETLKRDGHKTTRHIRIHGESVK